MDIDFAGLTGSEISILTGSSICKSLGLVSQFNILSDISYFNEHLINYWTHRKTNIDKTMTVSEENCFSTKYFYQTISL